MSGPLLAIALRLRLPAAGSGAMALIAMTIAVGALFPAVGHTIGQLDLPESVANLLGGADYGTITGWFSSEIASIYGPLLTAGIAIATASALTAAEEEDGITDLVLAHPVSRAALVVSRTAAVLTTVLVLALAAGIGLTAGAAVGGGGIGIGHIAAFALQLAFFGAASGSLAVAFGAATGRRSLTTGATGGIVLLGWLVNGFAPLVSGISWLRYLTFFYYYNGRDPLTQGIYPLGLIVLAATTAVLTVLGVTAFKRRDVRG